ncbi:predicted protein [Phaeodactylum tricornutum CCAP 1055/1]|jgi:hypothetical protein|uniref:Uncharacterized protein n=1 Tax=Phaeodactylum tricornutum (strain CCAP 1055/1) TaxID=556484 RepID=B7GA42_PHATC|nr:predicted protein [Phaeodactylum tricornutum CCAP 1055/1]EEC44671.1 predicted protein [Phaeodactylum tricornutum CCAP 1055/1]|eukprot:XP_002184002.1 predicted protein [Phaeodactylum tricornutum CCAP 1055/1]
MTMISKNLNNTTTETNLEKQTEQLRRSDGELLAETEIQEWHPAVKLAARKSQQGQQYPYIFVPLEMGGSGRTHTVSEGSRRLLQEEISFQDLQNMTELFYKKAFADPTLDQFIRSHNDPHGSRFAKWIHQKLSGSTVWDQDRRTRNLEPVEVAGGYNHVVHDRSSAHVAAWYSKKRPSNEVGRHFKLDEARVWMRLHFWAMRESGIAEKSPSFADYYFRFIAHFVKVYEAMAPVYARDSLRWSANQRNIQTYLDNGRVMKDVLGLSLEEAQLQIPEEERNDFDWPYNASPH